MRKANVFLLVTGVLLGVSAGHAGGVLQGLEMDVMDAGETASQATSRISLPRAGTGADDGSPDYAGLVSEQALIGAGERGEAAAVDYGNDGGAAAPEPTDGPVSGIDVGEPGPGETDAGGASDWGGVDGDGGAVGPEPGDTGVIDGVEEPIDGTPIGVIDNSPVDDGLVDDGTVSILPVEEPVTVEDLVPAVEADGRLAE